MLWIILFTLVTFILGSSELERLERETNYLYITRLIKFVGILIVVGFFGFVLASMIGFITPKKWNNPKVVDLQSLQDSNSTNDYFILDVNTKSSKKYGKVYFLPKDNKHISVVEIDRLNSLEIDEGHTNRPFVKIYKSHTTGWFWNFISYDGYGSKTKYEFFVPDGGVKKVSPPQVD